jgi:hypothetical protein
MTGFSYDKLQEIVFLKETLIIPVGGSGTTERWWNEWYVLYSDSV